MLSLNHPELVPQLAQMEYGLLPVRLPDGRFLLIIKATKEIILTIRQNNGFSIYIVPDYSHVNGSLGLISAFFDDHDEPLVVFTPLFDGDELLEHLFSTLAQGQFELYLFDEHDRELVGANSIIQDIQRFRDAIRVTKFQKFSTDTVHEIYNMMKNWFSARVCVDDHNAFCISLGERLYPDDMFIIDASGKFYGFQGTEGSVAFTSLERKEPGVYQEQDVAALLRRVFSGESIFLNPIREDTGKELCDVLVVESKFLILVQAKDSPNTEVALGRSIDRKRAVIRAHIKKGASQLRGAIDHCLGRNCLVLRTPSGSKMVDITTRMIWGVVVVQEMFDDDYTACSQPVLGVVRKCNVQCVLLDYPSLHKLTNRFALPDTFIAGMNKIFEVALEHHEYPKIRFGRR